jgi:hypothetical protein
MWITRVAGLDENEQPFRHGASQRAGPPCHEHPSTHVSTPRTMYAPMPETDWMVEATLKQYGVDTGGPWSLSSVR